MNDPGARTEQQDFKALYRKRARNYDVSTKLFYFLGFRQKHYLKKAVKALALKPGDTVVDIGCGTGQSFAQLQKAVGPSGRIIGVDLTDAMLERARSRLVRHEWNNIELVEQDAASYPFPEPLDAVYASYAITPIPEYDKVIENAAKALKPGGRMVILELKRPDNIPEWFVKLARVVLRPFGVKPVHATYTPWLSMKKHFGNVNIVELYFGVAYIAVSINEK